MPVRTILVPVADRPESAFALETAFELARGHEASVIGCHVRRHRSEEPSAFGGLLGAARAPSAEEEAEAKLNSESARALFERIAAERGFDLSKRPRLGQHGLAIWHEMVGTPDRILSIVGPVNDMLVASRPKAKASGPAQAFLLAALLRSGRPVLVLPQKRVVNVARRVLIAWNQSLEAAAALHASMAILEKAEEVTFVSAGGESRTGPKSSYAIDYLKHWGIKAQSITTGGRNPEQDLEETMKETKADLLIMGAYSRSRLRELVFGGVTEHMLFRTDKPVLMLHQ
jgi:nucleotide-binding universal stress UspA family protein